MRLMPIEFACESCKKLLRVPDGSGGLTCECPSCRSLLESPDPAAINIVPRVSDSTTTIGKLRIPCPQCSHELMCVPELLGSKGQCKNCKYIFTISLDKPTAAAATSAAEWIFSCPKCAQLFEGKEDMRGRRGKCHSCGEVFTIQLRPAEKPQLPTFQRASAQARSTSQPPQSISKSPPSSAGPRGEAGARSAPAIQLTCSSCQGVMEVPAAAAGQSTACPFCEQLLHIPSSHPSGPALDDFRTAWAGSGPDPLSLYVAAGAPQAVGGASQRSGARDRAVYIFPGVFITILGVLEVVSGAYIIMAMLSSFAERGDPTTPGRQGFVVGLFLAGAMVFVLAIFQILGGIALARRRGLVLARVAAIITCLPCVFCFLLNVPFGIWGVIVCFTGSVKRDFLR